jgi:hypothetical protein
MITPTLTDVLFSVIMSSVDVVLLNQKYLWEKTQHKTTGKCEKH